MLAICHTYYSMQSGVRSPADWAKHAAQRGYSALAIADINNLHGAVHFYRAAVKHGLRPIIGSTIQCPTAPNLIALTTSTEGYRQLCRLLTVRHLDSDFRLEKTVASGCHELLFLTRSPALLQRLAAILPAQNLYQLPPSPEEMNARTLWDTVPVAVKRANIPDAWFIEPDDAYTFAYRNELSRLADQPNAAAESPLGMLLPTHDEWQQQFPSSKTEEEIQERCRFNFTFGSPLLPSLVPEPGRPPVPSLRELCYAELGRRYSPGRRAAARAQLNRELQVIEANGFEDYFVYVNEIIRFAHRRGIPVQVRGSAGSSIVSFLLGFSACCPLDHDLLFERFMNAGRKDCPDIDIDIADNRRDEVINYCYDRWGASHVAMIATILTYRTRSAVHDAGRILRLPPQRVRDFLDEHSDIPQKTQLLSIAGCLAGLPRHLGIHCGGLVITPCPLTDVTPLTRASKGVIVTHYEKDQAEAIGLVKMDLLGNSGLSLLSESRTWLDQRGITPPAAPRVSDYKVARLFAKGDTLGVYQCESPGMRQLCQALKPKTPKEVSAALSLIRPGPAAAGMKDAFIKRRRGEESVTYLHPKMAHFLDQTYGVMLYQEDVMKVATNLAGYSIADADLLRRAVSKKRRSHIFEEERSKFIFEKASAQGVDEETAAKIWNQVSKFAAYSYCKAHASIYGRLAWVTAFLKAHYPREFYTAVLNCHKSMYPKRVFVWDAIRHGIQVLPPSIRHPHLGWKPGKQNIRAGLDLVKGTRESLCRQLVTEGVRTPFTSLRDLRERVDFSSGELERFILAGTCRELGSREKLLAELWTTRSNASQLSLFPCSPPTLPALLDAELLLMDIPFAAHPVPLEEYPKFCQADRLHQFIGRSVQITGILDAVKLTQTKRGTDYRDEMSFATLEDASGLFEVVLFPKQHQRFGRLFNRMGPYHVKGVVKQQWDAITLELHDATYAEAP
ncbi:MAG: DNA polymerase III subunit alpha [Lentisphaerae bacterium]|jgi:DNA polymerase III alpha subunit|nr:DNA polymerase III subunit alpha [Lentisphaerota bacterium]MBT4817353.1 DNA polymerase III subunit alpha [Lentisphaerota bacterium]